MNIEGIQDLRRRIDNLPEVARWLIMAFLMVSTAAIWYQGFWQELWQTHRATAKQIRQFRENLPGLEQQARQLEREVAEWKARGDGVSMFVRDTRQVLGELLMLRRGLSLVSMQSSFSQPSGSKGATPDRKQPSGAAVASEDRDDIEIKFRGEFFATLEYLQSIEKLPLEIFWDALEYRVAQYPVAEVVLRIHTIDQEQSSGKRVGL